MTGARCMHLRDAAIPDLSAIVEIYNQGVMTRASTGDTEPVSVNDRLAWFNDHPPQTHPIVVAELDGMVVGWGSLSQYRPGRKAFMRTVEISYYVHNSFKRRGVASLLIRHLLERGRVLGYKNVVAIILGVNSASIAVLEKYSFAEWRRLPGIAEIDGTMIDHVIYGRKLSL